VQQPKRSERDANTADAKVKAITGNMCLQYLYTDVATVYCCRVMQGEIGASNQQAYVIR
jgi:hypothetical protein